MLVTRGMGEKIPDTHAFMKECAADGMGRPPPNMQPLPGSLRQEAKNAYLWVAGSGETCNSRRPLSLLTILRFTVIKRNIL